MWHYRASKRKIPGTNEICYGVIEYYQKCGWSENYEKPFGATKKELIRDLEMMLEDVKKYKTLDETKGRE